ncbi:hypothetical protein N9878_00730 [bacterium]|nr:hypothetical protein [bacterium]
MNEANLTKLINSIEHSLINDSPEQAAQGLTELATVWSNAGMPRTSFIDMRKHIVERAIELTDRAFILEKLTLAERKLSGGRNGNSSGIITDLH